MNTNYLNRLLTFTEHDLPDLDEVVLGALAYLGGLSLPTLDVHAHTRPLVVGSGNAFQTGKILFRDCDAHVVEEGTFSHALSLQYADSVYILSASGSKHAILVAEEATQRSLPAHLITCTHGSPAAGYLSPEHVLVYPRIREPYTYNTSTYLSMLFGNEQISPSRVLSHIETVVDPLIGDLSSYHAFLMVIPSVFTHAKGMFGTKFDELFGPWVQGRITTFEGFKHAKTVVTAPHECTISLGGDVPLGKAGRYLSIPFFDGVTYPEVIAIGYYIIGKIQKAHPQYFKDSIQAYVKEASTFFGHTISTIVE